MTNAQQKIQELIWDPARAGDLLAPLRAGDCLMLTGTIYTGRDKAHQRLCQLLDAGQPLPLDLEGQIIYFAGPTPAKPGAVVGSIGPTTAGRMDAFSPQLLQQAHLAGMIGKGPRNEAVLSAMAETGALYFAAVGGAGALIGRCIRSAEVVAFADLGTEAIRRLEVERFPLIVAADAYGGNIYVSGPAAYRRL